MADPAPFRRLTPAEVLDHLRAFCVEMMALQPEWVANRVVPGASVRLLHDLEPDFDWIDFPGYFGLDLDQRWWDEWKPERTIGELCADLAGRIELPVWEPVTLLGRQCETAGAFLAIRRMLAADGADADRIGPSSPVAPYLRRHPAVFGRVRLASGGRLPHLNVPHPAAGWIASLVTVGGLTSIVGWVLSRCGLPWLNMLPFVVVVSLVVVLGLSVYARRHTAPYPADFRRLVYTLLGRITPGFPP